MYKKILLIAFVVLAFLGLMISSQAMAVVCNVPSPYLTIQAAVGDVNCDTINVAAGMYTEIGQIVINRNLTITGAGAGNTVIKPANDTDGSNNPTGAWIYVSPGNKLNLSNVTLDGSGRLIHHAIQSRGSLIVENCDIKNVGYSQYLGRGIVLFSGTDNLVKNCTFSNIQRIGVHVRGSVEPTNPKATIEGCTYIGKGVGDWLDYGFEAGGGGQATINNCYVSNNLGLAAGTWTSAGILATDYYGAGTSATVTNSTITNCTDGIAVGYSITDTTIVVAHNNSIYGNTDYGVNNVSTAVVVNAENNWWGDASGPGPVGLGTGDNVSLNVDYDPWLQIYWKDYNGGAPGGYMPDIDQNQDFDKVIARTEEGGAGVSYTGTWTTWPTPPDTTKASGGTLKYSNDLQTPASCSFTFNGTSISWIGFKQYNMGISEVWIDGQLDTTVDLYSVGSLWKQVLYTNNNLSHGQHTITIKPTNQKNPLSTGLYTGVDAFDVDNKEKEYCAPVAEANSLWWLNKKDPTLEIFADPSSGTGYIGGDINGDNPQHIGDILDLVQDLAIMMKTNQGHTGTLIADEQAGIDAFLLKYGLTSKLYEHTAYPDQYPNWLPYFAYIEEEVERSQDVKLDLGFWHVDHVEGQPGNWMVWWSRRGGHAVTVAGVDSQNFLLAISDPDNDAAENGGLGVIRPVPGGHPLHPNDPSVHNNEINASHDIYTVGPSPSPGGKMGLLNFPWKWNLPEGEWETVGPLPSNWTEPLYESMTFTEVEAAVIVSPIICGNNVVDPGEQCDDGNTNKGDGCSPTCKWEPDISVDPTSWDFGNVTVDDSSTKTFTISNTDDNGNLNIGTITITGTNFSKQNDNCSGQTIAPSGSCTVDVKFSPTAPLGLKSGTLSIPSDDPDENPLDVSLSGTAIAPAVTCSFTPDGTTLIRGGTLRFWVTVQNNDNATQNFKFATKVKLPNGSMYPPSGYVVGPIDVTLDPGKSKAKQLLQVIPLTAPYGTYTYYGYVGKVGVGLYGQCQFNFKVVQ